uniref:Similar to metalloprotease n=1 Tax=Nonomuraea gerenzanensis TaxID=93944 RepID=A0A1M4EJT2_9ACTN|nr:similar to metalloprotease [Nonomuraea gerenzanensis]
MALMAGALAGVLFAGTAHAATSSAPSYKPVLTKNKLYKTGKLGVTACEEPEVTSGTVDEAKIYFEAVMECLDKAWSPVVKKAGYRFSRPKLTVLTKVGEKMGPCGRFPAGAQAVYCPQVRSIYFLLSDNVVEEPSDLALMQVLAHEYGHHIQQLTGIMKAADVAILKNRSESRALEALRRTELQAQCLSASFVGRVWNSLGRPDTDWTILLKGSHNPVASLGVRNSGDETHASQASNKYWLERGFKAQSADVCNTWTAPSRRVY